MNFKNNFNQLRILYWLFRRDLIELKQNLKDNLIDGLLWPIKVVILFGYFMPTLGLPSNFGNFVLVGTVVTTSFFRIFDGVNKIINDLQFDGNIYFELTLGVNSALLLLRKIMIFFINACLMSFCVYVVGAVLVQDQFSVIPYSLGKSIAIFLLINFMFASLVLVIASFVKTRNLHYSFFSPLLFTSWDFGCYWFSWNTLYMTIPALAYIVLINPFTYSMEGFRSAVLGPEKFINYWICLSVIILLSAIFCVAGIKKFKSRVDCI